MFSNRWNGLLVLGIICLSPMAHAQSIVNGTFDTFVPNNGTGGGWTSDNIDLHGGWADYGNHSTSFILNAGGELNSDPTISQDVSGFTLGKTYHLTGDYASYSPSYGTIDTLSFGVSVNGVLVGAFARPFADFTHNDIYKSFDVDFVAPASTLTISLSGERGDDSSFFIDNIAVAPVITTVTPEPGSLALLLGAGTMGGTLLIKRRRK